MKIAISNTQPEQKKQNMKYQNNNNCNNADAFHFNFGLIYDNTETKELFDEFIFKKQLYTKCYELYKQILEYQTLTSDKFIIKKIKFIYEHYLQHNDILEFDISQQEILKPLKENIEKHWKLNNWDKAKNKKEWFHPIKEQLVLLFKLEIFPLFLSSDRFRKWVSEKSTEDLEQIGKLNLENENVFDLTSDITVNDCKNMLNILQRGWKLIDCKNGVSTFQFCNDSLIKIMNVENNSFKITKIIATNNDFPKECNTIQNLKDFIFENLNQFDKQLEFTKLNSNKMQIKMKSIFPFKDKIYNVNFKCFPCIKLLENEISNVNYRLSLENENPDCFLLIFKSIQLEENKIFIKGILLEKTLQNKFKYSEILITDTNLNIKKRGKELKQNFVNLTKM
ncbi:hypothetical protein ABK040_008266 [Willaertia magna]